MHQYNGNPVRAALVQGAWGVLFFLHTQKIELH